MPLKMNNIDHPSDNECTLFFTFHRWKFALFTSANRNSYLQEENHFEYKVIVKCRNGISHNRTTERFRYTVCDTKLDCRIILSR